MLDHNLDQVTHVLGAHTSPTVLKLCSDKRGVLKCLLDQIDVAQPELQVQVKRNESSFVEKSGADGLSFLDFEVDVREPGLFLFGEGHILTVNVLDEVLEAQSLLHLSLGNWQQFLLGHLQKLVHVWRSSVQKRL